MVDHKIGRKSTEQDAEHVRVNLGGNPTREPGSTPAVNGWPVLPPFKKAIWTPKDYAVRIILGFVFVIILFSLLAMVTGAWNK